MAFKKSQPPQNVPDSPEKILLDLPRRKIPGVLLHQGEVIKAYVATALKEHDVALQLPTGSGKTLAGLLIAEWRRRKFKERVVYLCPTNQLVNQVVEQAEDQYGLTVNGFTGKAKNYGVSAKAEYQNADRIAVTTYNALFNTNPYFDNPHVIIVDDAHAAEHYMASLWTVKIDRHDDDHGTLHTAVSNLLKPFLGTTNFSRLSGDAESMADLTWVDKIPTPELYRIHDEFVETVDANISDLDIRYSWSKIKDNLLSCHVYLSANDILIKPLIPPTWTHQPFVDATQRIFMSATLGLGGDLERLTGRKKIVRLPIPDGWDQQGIGRRFFMFPDLSLDRADSIELRHNLMAQSGRSLVLVPSKAIAKEISNEVTKALKFEVFSADDIEDSKKQFVESKEAVAVVANRYDGIDFPGNDCRLLFIDGLPKATNSQERFLMSRMGANILFNDRIQTRVLQAIGRCTRSLQDFSAIVVSGEELSNYLIDPKRRGYFHPELQSELDFGIEQSKDVTAGDIFDNFKVFLQNGKQWERTGNNQILEKRSSLVQLAFPGISILEKSVLHEIRYQELLWQKDYEKAYAEAETVLSILTSPELKGYRALWHYLAGSAALLADLKIKSKAQFESAKNAAGGIPWLVPLAKGKSEDIVKADKAKEMALLQIERVELIFEALGLTHSRKYSTKESEILDGLEDPKKFENAHLLLGEILGYCVGKVESDASPDPWWQSGHLCFVFEDNAGAESDLLSATKARQAFTHPNWIEDHVKLEANSIIIPVLVTDKTRANNGALPHLKTVKLWTVQEFKAWAKNALAVLRDLRRTFQESGDLAWRMEAVEVFKQNGLDAYSLNQFLQPRDALKTIKEAK